MTGIPELDPDAAQAAIEHCYEAGWSDGLPLVPATRELTDRFLAYTVRDPAEVIGRMEHLGRGCTVELAAINAAMAGCRPEYFPVVLAAWDALMQERAASGGGWQSTSGPAPLIVVNGPVRAELGFNSTGGVFGPGFRPNATVARAVGLIVRNAFGVAPHVLEQATQGLPGRWSLCIAENEEESPWEPLADEAGLPPGTSAVSATLLRTCEFVDNRHTGDPEQLLTDLADTMSRTGAWIFRHASAGVVFSPEHAQTLAAAGFAKADVRAWLAEHCGRDRGELARVGKDAVGENGVRHPGSTRSGGGGGGDSGGGDSGGGDSDGGSGGGGSGSGDDGDGGGGGGFERLLPSASPQDLLIAVAGARNAAMSMVLRVFAGWSGTAVPVEDVTAEAMSDPSLARVTTGRTP